LPPIKIKNHIHNTIERSKSTASKTVTPNKLAGHLLSNNRRKSTIAAESLDAEYLEKFPSSIEVRKTHASAVNHRRRILLKNMVQQH